MKYLLAFALILFAYVCAPAQRILVDHTSVALFEHIPPAYAEAASNLRLLFMDRSVGGNIDEMLTCLSFPQDSAPNYCRRWQHRDSAYAVDPAVVSWPGTWDRSRWRYEFWPSGCSESATCFIDAVESRLDSFDVVGFQFSYLAVMPGSKLADPVVGFFNGGGGTSGSASEYAAFAGRHSGKTILWWTTSLARGIGTVESQQFNEAMRVYARAHDLVLFDVADILSHDPDGNPCYDNRDGVQYLDENHPDDGLDIPAICPQYTTETEGGHLGSISAGGIRVAKSFWVLMARIAGWDGDTSATPVRPLQSLPRDLDLTVAPNPVGESFSASFTLEQRGTFVLELFDLLGRRRVMLFEGERPGGRCVLSFRRPAKLPGGQLLFLLLRTDRASATVPLLLR